MSQVVYEGFYVLPKTVVHEVIEVLARAALDVDTDHQTLQRLLAHKCAITADENRLIQDARTKQAQTSEVLEVLNSAATEAGTENATSASTKKAAAKKKVETADEAKKRKNREKVAASRARKKAEAAQAVAALAPNSGIVVNSPEFI